MIDKRELVWVARYKDGSMHTQYNVDGTYRDRYADIVRKELFSFELWTPDTHEAKPNKLILRLYFDTPNKKLIWRRRVFKKADGSEFFVYLAGWQMKVGGQNVQSINVVFEDHHIETIGRWPKKGEQLFVFFEPPIVHPNEGEDWSGPMSQEDIDKGNY